MQDKVTKLLKAVADPTRRDLFHALVLAASSLPITQISSQFSMTRQGVTKHLKVLEEARLIKIDSVGRERYCSADVEPLKEIQKWLNFYEKFWDTKLDNLEAHLDQKT